MSRGQRTIKSSSGRSYRRGASFIFLAGITYDLAGILKLHSKNLFFKNWIETVRDSQEQNYKGAGCALLGTPQMPQKNTSGLSQELLPVGASEPQNALPVTQDGVCEELSKRRRTGGTAPPRLVVRTAADDRGEQMKRAVGYLVRQRTREAARILSALSASSPAEPEGMEVMAREVLIAGATGYTVLVTG